MTKSKLRYLLISLFIASYVAVSGGVIAQTLGGGAGGSGTVPSPSGGLDTVSGIPNNGSDNLIFTGSGGGGGGAGGFAAGNGGGSALSPGGAGGVAGFGANGAPGYPVSDDNNNTGGGGGGGGAAGGVITTTSTNTTPKIGGNGGAGAAGALCCTAGSGGGGGAGGFGVIVNTGSITYTNSASILGGAGGAGGASVNLGDPNLSNGGNGGDGGIGVYLGGNLTTLNNSGIITGGNGGAGGTSASRGTAGAAGVSAPGVYVASGISAAITNTGTITGGSGSYSIQNAGTITTLNNLQGAGNAAGALTYSGPLPTNYNIIINSPASFGKLDATGGHSGTMNFGIYAGGVAGVPASVLSAGTYRAVLIGFQTPVDFNNVTTGKYGSYTWNLVVEPNTATWDLIISGIYTGPSVANTNQSLVNTASALQGTYTLQNSVLANSFSYDCTVFGANDVCVSAGGRNTQVQAANGLNNTSALLVAAYRPHPNYRIGAYADQNLSVSNPGGTVNLGNNTPLIGLFGAWNERLDGTGTEVKVSAAYGQKNTTITRSVVGSGATASEAGTGSSTLNSQGAQVTAKYGFSVLPEVIVSPYVGVRYTQNNMGGYTEGTSSSVTAPLTYSALNTNATTALAGVGASYRVIPDVTTFASAGVETDTNTANGTYSATNASIGTLTPVNFNANPVRTRPTATVGAYYDIEKNQRLGITGIYRQEAYQAVSTTTVMATYTIGL
ncbi:autotransporter outer membrane beta-barrel domain-containing protein [Polynucleobacter paneuropaeus]|nr:autotransporter outer membrane beta-barrel domain-containing protein [Polynucleobacter paneuropaeus]MBT8600402.1 autotransporter outer membrane beta-barrel domain-containing protein [Polynucleobacter paneuropaeus]